MYPVITFFSCLLLLQSFAEKADLTAPDGVYRTETSEMVRSMHAHLRVSLITLLGRENPSAHGMYKFMNILMDIETYLPDLLT